MERVSFELSPDAQITIESIGGDLRVSGRDEHLFEAQAAESGELHAEQTENGVVMRCRSGCLVFLPKEARLEVQEVGGDGRLSNLRSGALIRTVGGDLSLRRVGTAAFELIGGDFEARRVDGDLSVDRVGGDAVLNEVVGDVRLSAVGGDLMLNHPKGLVEASAGGDVMLHLEGLEDQSVNLQAGGDLLCRLPEEASATISVKAGGALKLPAFAKQEQTDEGVRVTLGAGGAQYHLTAGGDLHLQVGSSGGAFEEEIVGDLLTSIDAKLMDMEARFSAMDAGLIAFDAQRIGERVRRAVKRAQRKAERAASKGERKVSFNFRGRESQDQASDEERLLILRMVEQGSISVDEAEKLLAALEGES